MKDITPDDISKAYYADAQECQRLVRELCSDLRKIPAPEDVVHKADRLAELWGVNLSTGTDA